jgi:hypothetical protein
MCAPNEGEPTMTERGRDPGIMGIRRCESTPDSALKAVRGGWCLRSAHE